MGIKRGQALARMLKVRLCQSVTGQTRGLAKLTLGTRQQGGNSDSV